MPHLGHARLPSRDRLLCAPPRVNREKDRVAIDVVRYTRQPVRSAQVVLEISADPARVRPSMAEATLDVDGTPVRAQVAADRLHEAVDLLEARLRRQLVQLQDRTRTRHRWTRVVDEHEWRHGAEAASPSRQNLSRWAVWTPRSGCRLARPSTW